ncbi:hypothetical protein WDU94_002047 [Cyamophila willieti]
MKYPKGTPAGGTTIHVVGRNLQYFRHSLVYFYVYYKNKKYVSGCEVTSNITMKCTAPSINEIKGILREEIPEQLEYGFEMDYVSSVQNLSSKLNNSYLLYPNPEYYPLKTVEIKQNTNESLIIKGQHLDLASQKSDVVVKIGIGVCNVTSITRNNVTCRPPAEQPLNSMGDEESAELPSVNVTVGNKLNFYIGKLKYYQPASKAFFKEIDVIFIFLIFLLFVALLTAYRHHSTKSTRVQTIMQKQIDALESRVALECREAFLELQTEITELRGGPTAPGMPFLEYKRYVKMILFPNMEYHGVMPFEAPELKYEKFHQLLLNKNFLLGFIHILELSRNFSMSDRVKVASLIMLVLQSKMDYCTDILKTLLAELIRKCIHGKSNPKLLLRRTESIAEKMLSSWFTFLLYKCLRECAGEPLYLLFQAIKQQLDKGPVDVITGESRYALSDSKMISYPIDFKPLTVYVSIDSIFTDIEVKVLDCDTISQVKEKSLDYIYRGTPYSKRPTKIDDYDVELKSNGALLSDFDKTTKEVGGWKIFNTLKHYKVPDGAFLSLVLRMCKQGQNKLRQQFGHVNLGPNPSPTKEYANFSKKWHLVKRPANENHKNDDNNVKVVSEIYLMRLMVTKGTFKKFVDDLFDAIFSLRSPYIKYMFDFLDNQAFMHGIEDPEVVHIWKTNALPLRFWVNLIKNPNFLFDIHKSNSVDSCLSVVAQTFVDSCCITDSKLSKDSCVSKVLYVKDIPAYKKRVNQYYGHIKSMQAVSVQEMNVLLADESRIHQSEFSINQALHELYMYAIKYKVPLE